MAKVRGFIGKIRAKLASLWKAFRNSSRKKKAVIIILIIITAAIIGKGIRDATKEPPYSLAKAEVGSINEIVSESGNIVTSNRSDIYSPTNGIIKEIYVTNGDLVTRRQELFEVQSTATEQERKATEANYLAAASALNLAISTKDSLQADMFSKWQTFQDTATSSEFENSDGTPRHDQRVQSEFHIAEKNWLASEKKYKDQQTAIAQAQANVSSTKLLLDATKDAVVKATADGVVENISVSVGGGVTINQVLAPVNPVMTLVGNASTEVGIKVGESDVVKLKPGQSAKLNISAIKDKTYKGSVTRVDNVGTDSEGVIRYNVYILVEDPDQDIKPGMSVDADITTKSVKNVLRVPNSSVKPYKGGRAVRVVNKRTDEIEFVPVKIGVRGPTHTQIVSGIEEGQEVVTALSNESIDRPSLF